MAYIVPPSTVSDCIEDHLRKKNFSEIDYDKSDISKNNQELNNEQVAHSHVSQHEENIERNFKDVVCDVSIASSGKSCYHNKKKLENNETSNTTVNKIYLNNGMNPHESNKENKELQVDDKTSCNTDNSNNTVKKMLNRSLGLADNDSIKKNSDTALNKNSFIADNECCHGSPEYLHIVEHKNNSKNKSLRKIIDSEPEEDTQTSESNNFPQTIQDNLNTVEKYRAIIDSESEEEAQNEKIENNTFATLKKNKDAKKKLIKKRKGSIRDSKVEAMHQIHSETQRLLRETEISLPYHKPKQRTLQEFLNRKKISTALPKAPSTAVKLKISSAIVSQVLAEKEKEAELFYKSSDSEDDIQESISFASKHIKKSFITNEREKMHSIDIDHTQDLKMIGTNTHPQDFQDNKKESVQKNHLNLNTSRCKILLAKDFSKIDHQVVELSALTENNDNPDDESDTLLRQIRKTENLVNQDLLKLSLPRKLFDTFLKDESNNVSKISLDEQKIINKTEQRVETGISLNKEKYINENQKSKITATDNHVFEISKTHQDDSEAINRRDESQVIKMMKISGIFNSSKEIIETFQSDSDVSDNVIHSDSDNCVVTQESNNEKKDNYSEANNVSSSFIIINNAESEIQCSYNSSTNKCKKSDNHVQSLLSPKIVGEALLNGKKSSALVSNSKVTLKGSPGMVIDLTDNTKSNVKGVNTLLDRFFCKHVNNKKQNDNKSEVTIVHLQNTQNGLLPIKEVLPYKVPTNTDNLELNKPGAKLMRLKEDLKLQMTLKRNKEWKQKEIELQAQENKEWSGEGESDYDLDNEKKTELDFESSHSEESEPEENDICIKDIKRSKCLFADDEAEVTDNEDSSTEETYNESDTNRVKHGKQSTSFKYTKDSLNDDISEIEIDQKEEEENDNEEDEYKSEEGESEGKEDSLDASMKNTNESDYKNDGNIDVCKNFNIANDKHDKKIRQLMEEPQDDSNITNPSYLQNDIDNHLNVATDINVSKTHREDNDWISENESNTLAGQVHVEVATRSQICKTPLTKISMLDLVSPITQLSVLNSTLDSNKKDSSERTECLVDKHDFLSMENTQNDEPSEHIYNIRNKTILKKKLFDDIGETIDDEYLMRLCSGKFESTQRTDPDLSLQSNTTEISQLYPNKSELYPGNSNMKQVDDKRLLRNLKVNEDLKLISDEDSNSVNHAREINKVSAMDMKFKLRVASSDEDDEDTFVKSKKRTTRKFNLSDSEEENSQFSDEENDDVDNEEVEEQYVDYDSEENEVTVVPKKDVKQVAADFLEEEAELSESDWDSTDEDEKDLDKLEFEEADDEHIDEHEMKDQLEKIHMKQMLDKDKREVKLLKELLFEDGDLYTDGTGRERKFKWKNIDKLGNNIEIPQISDKNDGWVDVQEDEEETKWSKLRHERDKFLEERMKCLNNEIENELCDSQIFKLGLEAVRKIKDNESQNQDTSLDKLDPSENIEPIIPQNITDLLNGPSIRRKSQTIYNIIKKRSLLTRGEESLARIASLAKQGDSASYAINTRNFVFPHIDQSIDNAPKKENEINIEDLNSQIKPGKRKMSNVSSGSKKRRK